MKFPSRFFALFCLLVLAFISSGSSSLARKRFDAGHRRTSPPRQRQPAKIARTLARTNSSAAKPKPPVSYGRLPLQFEVNRGQTDSQVKFLARGIGYNLFLTSTEAVLALRYRAIAADESVLDRLLQDGDTAGSSTTRSQTVLRFEMVRANQHPQSSGRNPLPGVTNYYIGNDPSKWRTGIPSYAKVEYRNVYPGVNLVYYGNEGRLESDFRVAPGADPRAIRFSVAGAHKIEVDASGNLVMQTDGGEVRLERPVIYQTIGDARRYIDGGYRLSAQNEVSFAVGRYDHNRTLVIDPTLVYSTYLGGSGNGFSGDQGNAIAVDSTGEAYITGFTHSADFPMKNAHQSALGGINAQNAFVTKFTADGSALVFSTYLGGSSFDAGQGIALDSSGDAFVTGFTQSFDFPTFNAFQSALSGGQNAFVAKFDKNGVLLFSTFLGGNNVDDGKAIAVDSAGAPYITGSTTSNNFPPMNPFQPALMGTTNAFITKMKSDGSALIYSSYFGGNGNDVARGIALDSTGDAFLVGHTDSSAFPVKNPFQANLCGAQGCTGGAGATNAFVAEIKPDGSGPVYATYLGGGTNVGAGIGNPLPANDRGLGIAVDSTGAAYVTGFASSVDFPLMNSLQALDCCQDPFVAKFATGGAPLVFSTLFGGGGDTANAIALDASNNIYITGQTSASEFPTRDPLEATLPTFGFVSGAAFISELKPDGSDYIFSTFLTGSSSSSFIPEAGSGIAVDAGNNIYVTGVASTQDFPTVKPEQPLLGASFVNAFVAKISPATPAGPQVFPASLNFGAQNVNIPSASQRVTLVNGTNTLNISSITLSGANPGDFMEPDTCGPTLAPHVVCEITVTMLPTAMGTRSATLVITDDATPSTQTVTLTGTVAPPGTITVSPGSIAFPPPNTEVSTTSASVTVTVTNTSNVPVTFGSFNFVGNNPFDFFQTFASVNPCSIGVALAAGGNCTLTIAFHPTATGPRTATFQISGSFAASPMTVLLSGTGTAVSAVLSPTFLNFGNVVIGMTSPAMTVTLTNQGMTTLMNINGTVNNFGNSANFAIQAQGTTCTAGLTLLPGANCTFSITFSPVAPAGFDGASLTVTDSDPAPQSAFLNGIGLNPAATLAPIFPKQIFFGRVNVGATTSSFTGFLGLFNVGNTPLVFTAPITPTGNNPGSSDFAAVDASNCNFTIQPGKTCFLNMTFTPSAADGRFATVTINSNTTGVKGVPQSVTMDGTGVGGTTVSLLPNPVQFPTEPVGTSSPDQAVFFGNTGNNFDFVNSITITGTNPGDFGIDFSKSNCPFAGFFFFIGPGLDAGATCRINVFFNPTTTGFRTATLQVKDGASGSPHTVTLNGGPPSGPQVSLSTANVAFGNQRVGTTSSAMTVTLTNIGNQTLNIASVVLGDTKNFAIATGTTCTNNSTVTAGSNCIINLTFTPSSATNFAATVTLTDNNNNTPNSTQTINVTGTGITSSVSLSNSNVSFGNEPVGGTSAPMTVTVTNGGTAPLNFTSIAFGGTNPGDFADPSATTCVVGTPVAANGGTCVLSLTFTPTAEGNRSATLTLTDDATNSPQVIQLSGVGTQATVSLSTNTVNFGNQTVGTTSGVQTVTLTNSGNISVTLTSVGSPSGTNAGDFAIASGTTCATNGTVNANGGTCIINVTFTPSATGNRSATITITDNGAPASLTLNLSGNGTQATAALSTNNLSFGNQRVGTTSASQTVTVTNSGNIALNISTVAVTGNTGDFAILSSSTCKNNSSVPANGGTCTITVTFTPTTTGGRAATITLTDNATPTTQTITLSGTGIASVVALSTASVNFGNQPVNTTSGAMTVTVTNGGTAALNFSAISLGGTNPTDFAVVNTSTCLVGTPVNANSSCALNLTFTPSTATGFSATVTLTDDAPNSPQTVNLSGTGVTATVTLSTNNLSFGNQRVGTTSPQQTVTLTNAGNQALNISTVVLSGMDPGDFAILNTSTCINGATVTASGGTCVLNLTFTPSATGNRIAMITVTDNANPNTQTLNMAGVGTAPAVTLSMASLSFGNQVQGTTSAPQSVTLTNSGGATLNLTSIAVTGTNPGDFAVTGSGASPCPLGSGTVVASASCTFSVTFTPTALGARSASVTITDDATSSPQAVSLSGTGVTPPTATLSTNALSFGNQRVGVASAAMSVTVTNSGGAALNFASIAISGANAGDFSDPSGTTCVVGTPDAANGGTCTLSVTFTPTTTGNRAATITLTDNADATGTPGAMQTITLSGTGIAPAVTLSATSLTFGSQRVGTSSASQNVTISNTGSDTLNVSSISVTGMNPGDFAVLGSGALPCSRGGGKIAAGSSCQFSVTFTPAATGARSASVSIADDASGSPQTVALSGSGIAPAVMLVPTSLTFTLQATGTTSPAQSVLLTNSGTATLNITTVGITGDFALAASTTCTNGSTVAPNASCTINVTFSPTAQGVRNGSVSIADDATPGPQTITLTGTGYVIGGQASFSPSSLTFPAQVVMSTSSPQTITLSNPSTTTTLVIQSIAISGDFAQTNNCGTLPALVGPNSNCVFNVTFTPTATGTRTGALTVTDSATNSPQMIQLSGTGATVSLTPASGAPLTATVAPGDTAIFPIVLTSNGFTGTVTLTCSSPQQTISCAVIPSTVTVSGTTPIQTAIQVKTFCAWVAPPFAPPGNWPGNAPGLLWVLALLAMVLLGLTAGSQRRRLRLGMPLAALAVLAILGAGCASLPQSGAGRTPPGSYTLVITATPSTGAPGPPLQVTLNVT